MSDQDVLAAKQVPFTTQPHACCTGTACGTTTLMESAPVPVSHADSTQTIWRIAQMDCPTEEALLRTALSALPEVQQLDFNLMQRQLTVWHRPGTAALIESAIHSAGMTPELASKADMGTATPVDSHRTWPLVLSGIAAVGAETAHWLAQPDWLVALLALIAIAACGLGTYKKGWVALRHGNLNINALMSIAVTGAMLIGQWPEAAMVMCLFTLAEMIEAKSLDRARQAVRGLLQLTPEHATVQQADGAWLAVPAATVGIGTLVRVRPGERIALDGVIVEGQTTINQAPITGESLPVDKTIHDPVFAGTINQSGSCVYRVTAAASDSTLARIIHAIEAAQGSRAPSQRFVDRFAQVYTPVVFVIAVLVALLPPVLLDASWLDWIYKALVLLVIACPCALVISTPVTIVSGLAAAARRGILIKGGVYLEAGRKLRWLALDKTGTITEGKPALTDAIPLDAAVNSDWRAIAHSLADRSDHPVSVAIASANLIPTTRAQAVTDFKAVLGRGIEGEVAGLRYRLGNHRLVHELGLCSPELEGRLSELEQQGKTALILMDEQQPLALFAVADTVKPGSQSAIAALHRLGIKTVMLTGDNPHTALAVARQVGMDEALGNQLPEDKLAAVTRLAAQGKTGMVGDGINDAPALARADIGFAMGAAGTDTAIETADVALMDDDLGKIAEFVELSRTTHHVLIQNIVLALGIKAVFLALTLMGLGSMWMAVFADMGASLLVVANGLRLLRHGAR